MKAWWKWPASWAMAVVLCGLVTSAWLLGMDAWNYLAKAELQITDKAAFLNVGWLTVGFLSIARELRRDILDQRK